MTQAETLPELMARLEHFNRIEVLDDTSGVPMSSREWERIFKSDAAMREALEEMQVSTQEKHVETAIAALLARIDRDEL